MLVSEGKDPEMKLAKILTNEANELILRLRTRPTPEVMSRSLTFTQSLRRDAYLAYLDGKNARSVALHGLANKVAYVALRVDPDTV